MPRSVARLRQDRVPLEVMLNSWARSLDAENKAGRTIRSYTDTVRALIRWAGDDVTTAITTDDVRRFLAGEAARIKPNGEPVSAASVAVHYRNLRVFFGWLAAEEPSLVPVSPMARISPPAVPKKVKPSFTDAELTALLAACSGQSMEDRRDTAIMRVLMDTGMRVSGVAGLRYLPDDDERNDVLLGRKRLRIILKGRDQHMVPIGRKSAAAIDRYLRARVRHPRAEEQWLWLGPRGHFTHWGIRQMIERRGAEAGVAGAHPHRFRRTLTHNWILAGGSELDLMNITGWKSREMIDVYAGEMGAERAAAAHARLSPGDRI